MDANKFVDQLSLVKDANSRVLFAALYKMAGGEGEIKVEEHSGAIVLDDSLVSERSVEVISNSANREQVVKDAIKEQEERAKKEAEEAKAMSKEDAKIAKAERELEEAKAAKKEAEAKADQEAKKEEAERQAKIAEAQADDSEKENS